MAIPAYTGTQDVGAQSTGVLQGLMQALGNDNYGNQYEDEIRKAIAAKRQAYNDALNQTLATGGAKINEQFAPLTAQALSDASALGGGGGSNMTSPAALNLVNKVRDQKARTFSDFVNNSLLQNYQNTAGLEGQNADAILQGHLGGQELAQKQRMSLADLAGGLRNNEVNYGLQRQGLGQKDQGLALTREQLASQGAQNLADQEESHSMLGQLQKGFNVANTGLQGLSSLGSAASSAGQISGYLKKPKPQPYMPG